MDQPSTSYSDPLSVADGDQPLQYQDLAAPTGALLAEVSDPYPELLGLLDAQIEFCEQMAVFIAKKRTLLAEKKAWLEKKLDHERGLDSFARSKVPVMQYLPPYFKDDNMMCPPLNEEARHKHQHTTFDPLTKEDKKWTPSELRLLKESVKSSVIQAGVQKYVNRKDVLRAKLQRAGVETSPEEIQQWKNEIEDLDRKIKHSREGQLDSSQVDMVDYSCVDWLKISTVEFKGSRSAAALRYKWLNEQCPRWNSGPWTKEELGKLKELREDPSFTSWAALAKKLQTQRTPYQCFERYRSDMLKITRDWTKEEDDRLIALVKVMTVNGVVQWDKVAFYMPGRIRQQVRTRYQRTLDENVRHGRWTDHEDLLLMSAVARFGAKDWAKVARAVVGRSDGQCRERWCNVLDKCTLSGEWTPEEDERLILGVQLFGRGHWSKLTEILPRHTPESMMDRYQALLAAKMRLCSARLMGFPAEYRSSVQLAVHKAKRDVLRQQLHADTLKAQCYRAAKEQSDRSRAAKKKPNEVLTDEERQLLDKGIEELSEKYKNADYSPDMKEVFKKISLSEKEVSDIITAAKRRVLVDSYKGVEPRRRRVAVGRMNVKKIRPNSYLRGGSGLERTEFEPHETEEDRVRIMTESLCRAVRKYDHFEWCNRFYEDRMRPENVAATFANNLLSSRCSQVASRLRECAVFPYDLTLPPIFSTVSAHRVFESARVLLTRHAATYFYPTTSQEDVAWFTPEGELLYQYTIYDRLLIQLHPDVLGDDNYLKLKTQVRAVLLEPTRLAMAIESPESEERRNRAQMKLTEFLMAQQEEMQSGPPVGLEDIASEVVIGRSDVLEPIYYEDKYDDALNATIHTVMDRASQQEVPKRRRGRLTNAERWLAQYRALQQGLDEPSVSKVAAPPPASPKVTEMVEEPDASPCSAAPESQSDSVEQSETANKEQEAEGESTESQATVKRKRGRPSKSSTSSPKRKSTGNPPKKRARTAMKDQE